MQRFVILGLLVVLLQGVPSSTESLIPAVVITDLGTLPGDDESFATAVGRRGQVVGASALGSLVGERHAFRWTAEDGMQPLPMVPGSVSTQSVDINDHGQIVGVGWMLSGAPRAVLWSVEGEVIDLGTLGGDSSLAIGINERGEVVGWSQTVTDESHAFLWTQEGGMRDLGTLGGGRSVAFAINDLGQVVGDSRTPTGEFHAFLWSERDGMKDLGTLGGRLSVANALNNLGQVVGYSWTTSAFRPAHAFLWTAADRMVDLGTLGGDWGRGNGINTFGQVVGDSSLPSGNVRAFVWTETEGMQDLGTLAGDFGGAAGINDSGQVVGLSQTASGKFHATLWWTSLPVSTVQDILELLRMGIDNLLATENLTQDQAAGLLDKLSEVEAKLQQDNGRSAAQQLAAFLNQVQGFVAAGVLQPEEAQSLNDLAESALRQLGT